MSASLRASAWVCASLGLTTSLLAWDPPTASPFRSAFEAQFPKSGATSGALELERLAGEIGLDLVPRPLTDSAEGEGKEPAEPGDPAPPLAKVDDERPRPSNESAAALQGVLGEVGPFLDRELKNTGERIGIPPQRVERFYTEHVQTMTAIEALLTGDGDIGWELDVTRYPSAAPLPNFSGLVRLQRLLVAKSLLHARRGETDGAVQSLDAGWRLNEALAARPELISQLIVVATAKFHAGALRKVGAGARLVQPAPGRKAASRLPRRVSERGLVPARRQGPDRAGGCVRPRAPACRRALRGGGPLLLDSRGPPGGLGGRRLGASSPKRIRSARSPPPTSWRALFDGGASSSMRS